MGDSSERARDRSCLDLRVEPACPSGLVKLIFLLRIYLRIRTCIITRN